MEEQLEEKSNSLLNYIWERKQNPIIDHLKSSDTFKRQQVNWRPRRRRRRKNNLMSIECRHFFEPSSCQQTENLMTSGVSSQSLPSTVKNSTHKRRRVYIWPSRSHSEKLTLIPSINITMIQLMGHSSDSKTSIDRRLDLRRQVYFSPVRMAFILTFVSALVLSHNNHLIAGQATLISQSDPRPTIYSGQVSFGLLLSAHSSMGNEMSTSASHQVNSIFSLEEGENLSLSTMAALMRAPEMKLNSNDSLRWPNRTPQDNSFTLAPNQTIAEEFMMHSDSSPVAIISEESQLMPSIDRRRDHNKRQIFTTGSNRLASRQQIGVSSGGRQTTANSGTQSLASSTIEPQATCGQVNPNALYAGMSAIWASHQANLVGDSHLAIGTYVYDSCNDLDVGQRQAVRIVSNLNAFQQTTCESPRGSPISLTIAHGDNQLRAIQLLTSFKVPVITTKEHFALEDYTQLSRDQRKYLFSTAPSSRYLAIGALRFTKRIVSRSSSSPKLLNQFYKMSSRNGLIVISRNLPAKFIAYLTEVIPNHVNYEMLQSNQPIDQIRSVEALESILIKNSASSSDVNNAIATASESRVLVSAIDANLAEIRAKRESSGDPDVDSSLPDFDSPGDGENPKMLSPTILMFITPAEAIDLVTRLRNDLAEVSKYYSLIVSTREDISPALKTIFHRGGSRLCSGKAFYTISPKPDEIGEFSRYFRDTVQMEGETSDHPLICEYSKHQSTSKTSADLDDISTEPVIKAVWAAAAAFKSVYRRECANSASNANLFRSSEHLTDQNGASESHARVMSSRQSKQNSASADCMSKMNKVMSSLVQRSLKRLDVTINSTGLQAFDGFRIKFDDVNELLTNKFSINYVNKECEITEIGEFSGEKDSSLDIDEEQLVKSLESSLPDPWPISVTRAPASHTAATTSANHQNSLRATPISTASTERTKESSNTSDNLTGDTNTNSNENNGDESSAANNTEQQAKRRQKSVTDYNSPSGHSDEEEDDGSGDGEVKPAAGASDLDSPSSKRTSKRSRNDSSDVRILKRNKTEPIAKSAKIAKQTSRPPTGMSGRGMIDGSETNSPAQQQSSATDSGVGSTRPMRVLKPFQSSLGTTLKDWLPTTRLENQPKSTTSSLLTTRQNHDNEQVDSSTSTPADLKTRGTTEAPVYTSLPESDGNADLELSFRGNSKSMADQTTTKRPKNLDVAASTPATTDYVTSPSIVQSSLGPKLNSNNRNALNLDGRQVPIDSEPEPLGHKGSHTGDSDQIRFNYLRVPGSSPLPVEGHSYSSPSGSKISDFSHQLGEPPSLEILNSNQKMSRSKLGSHLKWIYSSWYALTILAANVCGALFTLYILTFLLMKNCDGSLDRENQGMRSMHLLAIIVVFFGSTLFIVYPTPVLCLLRTSWRNFALVLLFGSLLLQTMQTRSLSSLGLGGRPNRLNQFLTLVFMVAVQVAYELQRWKYESETYLNFVSQYLGSSEGGDKKLYVISNNLANQFNPLNSFNDHITPVSLQLSERYQSILQEYCTQHNEDFIQSQIYLFVIVGLLVIFSLSTRKSRRLPGRVSSCGGNTNRHHKLKSTLNSGKLVASQHEANLDLSPSQFEFSPNVKNIRANANNLFVVITIIVPLYVASVLVHIYCQNTINTDLSSSVTLVLVAFTTLIGIFMPILRQVHRYEDLLSDHPICGTITRPVITTTTTGSGVDNQNSLAFTMFPEFSQTGLRRPSSMSEGSSSGAGSRRPFAETKESRRNMGVALANLGPSADSLRSMGLDEPNRVTADRLMDPAALNLRLNVASNGGHLSTSNDDLYRASQRVEEQVARRNSKGEKRLIMLDVDPCCPRHGVVAWPRNGTESSGSKANTGSTGRYNHR